MRVLAIQEDGQDPGEMNLRDMRCSPVTEIRVSTTDMLKIPTETSLVRDRELAPDQATGTTLT